MADILSVDDPRPIPAAATTSLRDPERLGPAQACLVGTRAWGLTFTYPHTLRFRVLENLAKTPKLRGGPPSV